MVRLIHERQREFGEIDEVDLEPAGLLGFRPHPLRDGQAHSAGANTSDDDHQLGHSSFNRTSRAAFPGSVLDRQARRPDLGCRAVAVVDILGIRQSS